MQLLAHHLLQRLRSPVLAIVHFDALTLLHLAQYLAHLRENRQRQAAGLRIAKKPPATDVAQQDVGPAPQQQPRYQRQKQRQNQHRDARKGDQVIARGILPPVDETQIVHDRDTVRREPGRTLVKRRYLCRARGRLKNAAAPVGDVLRGLAVHGRGHTLGLEQRRAVRIDRKSVV